MRPAPSLRIPVVLSWLCVLIAVLAGTWTVLDPGLLHGPEAMQGSARGTALVVLVLAVPTVVVAMTRAQGGSRAALLVWAGGLLYLVYNAVLFLFLTPFNSAFLAYVALLSTALWSVATLAATRDLRQLARSLGAGLPERSYPRVVAVYLGTIVVLNTLAWLRVVVPALSGPFPAPFLDGTGVATNAIYAQDLAVWLPLAGVSAVWLWRGRPLGYLLAAAVLTMWAIEGVSVAADQWWGHQADPASQVVFAGAVVPFLVLAAVGTVPVWLLLHRLGRAVEPPVGTEDSTGEPAQTTEATVEAMRMPRS
jgi:hypothetical protein